MKMIYDVEIRTAAGHFGIDPLLVGGLVSVESNFNPFAWNPEPRYRYFWDVKTNSPFRSLTAAEIASEIPPSDFPSLIGDKDQEWWAQSASWGLMQLMGAVAREHGCASPYLTQLVDPVVNLEIGCTHLAALLKWAHGDVEQACAAYNGGKGGNSVRPFHNQGYASKVVAARLALL